MKHRSPADLERAVAAYRSSVDRYRSTLDLVSPRGWEQFDRHLDDARIYAEIVGNVVPEPRRLIDVGSGVGLPGVVVAITWPDLAVELVERRRKRATFLRGVVAATGASNAAVVEGDVRSTTGPEADVVVAQAVADFTTTYRLTEHRHGASVVLISRKARGRWRAEVDALSAEVGQAATVLAAEEREPHGTVVAVRVVGGRPCRSSL